jgi:hypothetical protein
MYDAVTAHNIPSNAQMVAGYGDTIKIPQWTQADWDLFPNATKLIIVKKASSNFGHALDVETGDATPAEAPGWAVMRRKAGGAPIVYCNASTWPAVKAAFASANVDPPLYWIAQYNGIDIIPAGAIGKQYASNNLYDTSVMEDSIPGVDDMAISPDDAKTIAQAIVEYSVPKVGPNGTPSGKNINAHQFMAWADVITNDTWGAIAGVQALVVTLTAKVDALSAIVASLPKDTVTLKGTFQMDNNSVTPGS